MTMQKTIICLIAFGLIGCATSNTPVNETNHASMRDALGRNILSVADAENVAGALGDYYLVGADRSRNRRAGSNLAIIGLNAYTAAALAFGWHADNALTSSSLANLVSALAGNSNAQGETPFLTAIGQTRCIVQNLNTARQFEILVPRSSAAVDYPQLDQEYQAILAAVRNGYWQVFLNFRRSTTVTAVSVTVPTTDGGSQSLFNGGQTLSNEIQQALLAGMRAEKTAIGACTTSGA